MHRTSKCLVAKAPKKRAPYKEQQIVTKVVAAVLHDKIEGLTADLDAALDLMVRVATGKQTTAAMGRWVSLNYPKHRRRLPKAIRELPPQRAKTKKVMRAKK